MSFNTIPFLAFFALTAVAYYRLPRSWQGPLLGLASAAFYLLGATPGLLGFLVLSALSSWLCGRAVVSAATPARRRAFVWLAVGAQLAVLGFFKYSGFFAPGLGEWLAGRGFPYVTAARGGWRLMLPLGISYYSFQSLSYVLDLARGQDVRERNFWRYLLFVGFFPQLTAGPIGRAGELLPQLRTAHAFDYDTVADGLRLMLLGFFKKIAVADMLAMFVDTVFADYTAYSGLTLTAAVLLYAMQLYCDFSGYSDIARGCAGVLGIRLRENFNTPYLSTSFRELWRRWHISLSSWLRDYVYIGLLGGNRRGRWRTYLNVMLTYLFSGLWHGVGWTYLVWGGAQGLLQVFEGMARHAGRLRDDPHGPAFALRAAGVFLLNAALLTIFRAPTLRDGLAILAGQFRGLGAGSFVRQCAAAIGAGFNATPLLMAAWAAFCAVGLAAVVASDLLRRFRLQGECLAVWLGRQRAAVRWCIYYGLLAFVAAAFLMQNGNYVGSVSFAYGGF